MFLVSDMYDINSNHIEDYKGIKNLLISEIKLDTKNNYKDYEVVSYNTELLIKMMNMDFVDEKFIISQLESYGWIVVDLRRTTETLENLKKIYERTHLYTDNFDEVINWLKGVKAENDL